MEYFQEYDILPQGQNAHLFVLLADRYLGILFCEIQKQDIWWHFIWLIKYIIDEGPFLKYVK